MNILVDTSVWSLALRRDQPAECAEVAFLEQALRNEQGIFTTGIILQELLQGVRGPKSKAKIVHRFSKLGCVVPSLPDHIAAAELRNRCRRKGIQIGTIDALIAQLALAHELHLLALDRDFVQIAKVVSLQLAVP